MTCQVAVVLIGADRFKVDPAASPRGGRYPWDLAGYASVGCEHAEFLRDETDPTSPLSRRLPRPVRSKKLRSEPVIPFLDLKAQYRQMKPEIDAAVARVIESAQFVLGPEVADFEKRFADVLRRETLHSAQ